MLSNRKIKKILFLLTTVLFTLIAVLFFIKREEQAKLIEAEAYHQEHSFFEDIRFFGNADALQGVRLFENHHGYYCVFLPGELFGNISVEFSQFQELIIGEETYQSGEKVSGIIQDVPYAISAKGWDDTTIEEGIVVFYYGLGLPSVYLESEGGSLEAVNNDRNIKEKGRFSIITEQGEKDSSGECSVRTRGNSSFDVPQKSYSLNTDLETTLLGMSPCSEWTLLANYKGSTHQLKNKIVLILQKRLE